MKLIFPLKKATLEKPKFLFVKIRLWYKYKLVLSFLPLINSSVTRDNSFVLDSKAVIISSKIINKTKPKTLRNHY